MLRAGEPLGAEGSRAACRLLQRNTTLTRLDIRGALLCATLLPPLVIFRSLRQQRRGARGRTRYCRSTRAELHAEGTDRHQ
jgi:hypothetical protein